MENRISRAWFVLAVTAFCCAGSASRASAQCASFPSGYIPFTQVYAIYPANPGSIVVGAMTTASYDQLSSVPLPTISGQTFCVVIQLAPGFFVTAYVPTVSERFGDFSAYLPGTELLDPINDSPYPNNLIPPQSGVFAWHIVGPALPPVALAQAVIAQVNALNSQAVLNSGQDNSLVTQLQNSVKMINAGKIHGAIGILQSFISEVQDLEKSGVLTLAQASALINAANSMIVQLA